MNKVYAYRGICFVWDEAKSSQNYKKHGVSFERAVEAFFDPFLKVIEASQRGEYREAVLGRDERGVILFVVHVDLSEDGIRLISARKATKKEREDYESE